MIVDFQHHFTPRELIKEDPGDRLILHYDAQGAPSYTIHKLLYDLDEHVRMMDEAGIDAAWLTSAQGMCADLETSRFVNDKAKKAERDYPGRFIGAAHAHPLGGPDAHEGAQPLQARARLPGRGDHLGDRRPVPRQSGATSRSGPRPRSSACSCSCIRRSSSTSRSSSTASTPRARSGASSR